MHGIKGVLERDMQKKSALNKGSTNKNLFFVKYVPGSFLYYSSRLGQWCNQEEEEERKGVLVQKGILEKCML